MNYVWGLLGIATNFAIALLLSSNRKAINIRTILAGLAIQVGFAVIVLKWEYGKKALEKFTNVVNEVVGYANEGINFLFGGLFAEGTNIGTIFAFQVLPIVGMKLYKLAGISDRN